MQQISVKFCFLLKALQIKGETTVLEIISIEYTELEHLLQKIIAVKVKMDSIFVRSGCHNKTPSTGWLQQQNLFLTVLPSRKSKIKVLANLGPGESSLPGVYTAAFPLCTHLLSSLCAHMEREFFILMLHCYYIVLVSALSL